MSGSTSKPKPFALVAFLALVWLLALAANYDVAVALGVLYLVGWLALARTLALAPGSTKPGKPSRAMELSIGFVRGAERLGSRRGFSLVSAVLVVAAALGVTHYAAWGYSLDTEGYHLPESQDNPRVTTHAHTDHQAFSDLDVIIRPASGERRAFSVRVEGVCGPCAMNSDPEDGETEFFEYTPLAVEVERVGLLVRRVDVVLGEADTVGGEWYGEHFTTPHGDPADVSAVQLYDMPAGSFLSAPGARGSGPTTYRAVDEEDVTWATHVWAQEASFTYVVPPFQVIADLLKPFTTISGFWVVTLGLLAGITATYFKNWFTSAISKAASTPTEPKSPPKQAKSPLIRCAKCNAEYSPAEWNACPECHGAKRRYGP